MALKRPEMGSLISHNVGTIFRVFQNNGKSIYDINRISQGTSPMDLKVPKTESTTNSRHIYHLPRSFPLQTRNSNFPHNISANWPTLQKERLLQKARFQQIPSFYEIDRISLRIAPTSLKVPESDSLMNFRHTYDLLEIVFRPKPNSNSNRVTTKTTIHQISHISLNFSPISLKVPEMRPPLHRRRRRLR